jgi:AAA15 family ATPase/GTPase
MSEYEVDDIFYENLEDLPFNEREEKYNERLKLYKKGLEEQNELFEKRDNSLKDSRLYRYAKERVEEMYRGLSHKHRRQLLDEKFNKRLQFRLNKLNTITDFDTLKKKYIELLQYDDTITDFDILKSKCIDIISNDINTSKFATYRIEQNAVELRTRTCLLKEISKLREENEKYSSKLNEWRKLDSYATYYNKKQLVDKIKELYETE